MALTATPFLSLSASGSIGTITARNDHHRTALQFRNGPRNNNSIRQLQQQTITKSAQSFAHWYVGAPGIYSWEFQKANTLIWQFPSMCHFWMSLFHAQKLNKPALLIGFEYSESLFAIPVRDNFYELLTDWPPDPFQMMIASTTETNFITLTSSFNDPEYLYFDIPEILPPQPFDIYFSYHGKPAGSFLTNVEYLPPPPPP